MKTLQKKSSFTPTNMIIVIALYEHHSPYLRYSSVWVCARDTWVICATSNHYWLSKGCRITELQGRTKSISRHKWCEFQSDLLKYSACTSTRWSKKQPFLDSFLIHIIGDSSWYKGNFILGSIKVPRRIRK